MRHLIKVIMGYWVEKPEDLPQEQTFTQLLLVSQHDNYSTVVLSVEDKYLVPLIDTSDCNSLMHIRDSDLLPSFHTLL